MKPGQQTKCSHCGKECFLVKKTLMDGWTKLGDILACSCCSAKIADLDGEKTKTVDTTKKFSALEDLLAEKKKEGPKIESSEDEKHFCRDCMHFVSHPFLNRCGLHKKNVGPMDDCDKFEKK
ncbi:MAG TPA: hypothetical protein DET40_23885 [Lentisphaeria bacterium]|nr:MAG: hypothetical protein A2X45_09185 [Lentisphaerae bacterium GWF2_50_93]HCE46599.1 hypothetical protein [Lentisphaeria bacterium]